MARQSIFANTTLSFVTYAAGGIDPVTRKWVDGAANTPVDVLGSLQPFIPRGNEQIVLDDKFTLDSSWMFVTTEALPTINDLGHEQAAQTTIEGRTYYVAKDYNFSRSPLSTARHFYILVMMKMVDGSV